jgi:hypothetical protein
VRTAEKPPPVGESDRVYLARTKSAPKTLTQTSLTETLCYLGAQGFFGESPLLIGE